MRRFIIEFPNGSTQDFYADTFYMGGAVPGWVIFYKNGQEFVRFNISFVTSIEQYKDKVDD